jgi:hypothetical protein
MNFSSCKFVYHYQKRSKYSLLNTHNQAVTLKMHVREVTSADLLIQTLVGTLVIQAAGFNENINLLVNCTTLYYQSKRNYHCIINGF